MSCLVCFWRALQLAAVIVAAALVYGAAIPLIELGLIMNGYANF